MLDSYYLVLLYNENNILCIFLKWSTAMLLVMDTLCFKPFQSRETKAESRDLNLFLFHII